jgi:four helix bundle protein
MGFTSFEEMPVWQKTMELSVQVFKLIESLPRKEDYGLTSQMRRSGLSVPAILRKALAENIQKIN